MDLTSKKVAKNIIKLALCIKNANRNDLLLLASMIDLKTERDENFYDDVCNLKKDIACNTHICALLGIKDKY